MGSSNSKSPTTTSNMQASNNQQPPTTSSNFTEMRLYEAMKYQDWEAVKLLLQCVEPDKQMEILRQPVDTLGHTTIHQLAMLEATKGCAAIEAIIESIGIRKSYILLSERDRNGQTPLHLACHAIQKKTILFFLSSMKHFSCSENRQIFSSDHTLWSPLHYVGDNQITDVISDMRETLDLDRWKLLLRLKNKNGLTAYDLAVGKSEDSITHHLRLEESQWNSLPEAILSEIAQEPNDHVRQQWIQSIIDQFLLSSDEISKLSKVSTQYIIRFNQTEGRQCGIILLHKDCETKDKEDHLVPILQSSGVTVMVGTLSEGTSLANDFFKLISDKLKDCKLLFIYIIASEHRMEKAEPKTIKSLGQTVRDFKQTISEILPKGVPLVMIAPRCCIHPLDEGVGSTWLDRPDTLVVSVARDLLSSVTDVAEALHDSIDGQENIHELLTNILNKPENQNPSSSQYQTVMQSTLKKFLIPPQSLKHEDDSRQSYTAIHETKVKSRSYNLKKGKPHALTFNRTTPNDLTKAMESIAGQHIYEVGNQNELDLKLKEIKEADECSLLIMSVISDEKIVARSTLRQLREKVFPHHIPLIMFAQVNPMLSTRDQDLGGMCRLMCQLRPNTVIMTPTVTDQESTKKSFMSFVADGLLETHGQADVFSMLTRMAFMMSNSERGLHVECISSLKKNLVLSKSIYGPTESDELITALANATKTDINKQKQPNQQVEMRMAQDNIFESLRQFGDYEGSSTISCILITSLTQERETGKDTDEDFLSHLLVLISGEISITSHHFNIGERFMWQISKEKFLDDRIHSLIKDLCFKTPSHHGDSIHLPDMMMISIPPHLPNGSDAIPRLVSPVLCAEVLSCRSDPNPLRFHLYLRGNSLTADFQIWQKNEQVDEVSSYFEQYESSSEGSDAHHIAEFIDQLDVDEDERCVTVVVMAALGSDDSSQYLLHLIAGRLTQPIVTPDNRSWKDIQTHYVGNSSLYDEITRKSTEGLESLDTAKRDKVLDNPPRYVVTSNFPSRTFDEKFRISDVILPEVSHGNGEKQVYIYRNHRAPQLCLELHEPASPMFSSYSNSRTTKSSSLSVTDKNPMEDLDRKHYKLFTSIYSECDKQGSFNDTVSAITCVARLPTGEMTVGLFLLSGTWFGKGVADIHPGWKVTVMPVFNPKLRKKVEAFTGLSGVSCSTKGAKAAAITEEDLDSNNVLGAGSLEIYSKEIRTTDKQGKKIWRTILQAQVSHSTQTDLCAVFTRIEEDELQEGDLEKLSLPIPISLLDITTYERFEGILNSPQENRVDDSESVMISVHSLKTKLAVKKKSKRSRPGMQEGLKVCLGDPLCNIMIILAVGKPSEICYPHSLYYRDPLNTWECQTFCENSKQLKTIIEKEWSNLKEKFGASKSNVWQSVAHHMVLDASSGSLKLVPLKLAGERSDKLKIQPTIIEFASHATDDQSIGHALASCEPFLRKCKEWHENEKSDSIFCDIRSAFFGESSLPTSYKFPTSKFKHSLLPRPDQLGCSSASEPGSLFLLYHDEAHLKISHIPQARSIEDKEIKEQLKKTWEVLNVNQNQLAEQGAVGGATARF